MEVLSAGGRGGASRAAWRQRRPASPGGEAGTRDQSIIETIPMYISTEQQQRSGHCHTERAPPRRHRLENVRNYPRRISDPFGHLLFPEITIADSRHSHCHQAQP